MSRQIVRAAPAQSKQDGRILCADCADHLAGLDPCGSWWNGKPHTCASFRPIRAHQTQNQNQYDNANHTEAPPPCSNA